MSWTFVYLGVIICMNLQHCFLKADNVESDIYFNPPQTEYFLSRGDSIPSITCHVTCDLECNYTIRWTKMGTVVSNSSTLSPGKASLRTSGEYICDGQNGERTMHKSVYISVQDDDDANSIEQLRTAVVILGCVVAVVTILSITTVLWLCRKKLKCDCDEMSMCEKTEFSFDHNITDIVATGERKSKTEEQKPKTENNSVYEGLSPETMVKDETRNYGTLERERRNRNLQPETTDDNRSLDDYMKPVSSHDQNDTELDELENIYDPVKIENMPDKADPESDNEEFYENIKF